MRKIPGELIQIPESYFTAAGSGGHVERLIYQTYESMTYARKETVLTKTAYIYLPHGYSREKQYDVFYMMHGGWGNETTYLGTDAAPSEWVNVLDHAIADGLMKPFIVVCPTYNNTSPKDSGDKALALALNNNYHHELIHDLLPAVESRYSTYARGTQREDFRASRAHRLFGGFSMGCVATLRAFEYCLDCFSYFIPTSGERIDSGEKINELVRASGFGADDFYLYMASGSGDFACQRISAQIKEMLEAPGSLFVRAAVDRPGNLSFLVQEGAVHDRAAALQYTYNGLLHYFSTGQA